MFKKKIRVSRDLQDRAQVVAKIDLSNFGNLEKSGEKDLFWHFHIINIFHVNIFDPKCGRNNSWK